MPKSKEVETFPLFLSETYKQLYDRSMTEMENRRELSPGLKKPIEERKRAKAAAKMYK